MLGSSIFQTILANQIAGFSSDVRKIQGIGTDCVRAARAKRVSDALFEQAFLRAHFLENYQNCNN